MKPFLRHAPLWMLLLLASACQSVEQLSIDYMLPAEVSFPATLKRVAVVNNMSDASQPASAALLEKKEGKGEHEVARKTDFYTGNPVRAAQALADALADGNYFDQVIICDSALRAHDTYPRESTLSREEVNQLSADMGADFLIAVENVQLRSVSKVDFLPDLQAYYGTVDVTVYPTLRIYIPNRRGPVATLCQPDSIFWEEAGGSEGEVHARLIHGEELIEAASDFAGAASVGYLLPHWKTATRYLFTGGSVDMRDAAVYVREQNWDGAIALWKRHFSRKKGKQKMYAACNIALGYEMQDSLAAAVDWAEQAMQVAREIDRVDERQEAGTVDASLVSNYVFAYYYWQELQERQKGMARLNVQMRRFEEEP